MSSSASSWGEDYLSIGCTSLSGVSLGHNLLLGRVSPALGGLGSSVGLGSQDYAFNIFVIRIIRGALSSGSKSRYE